MSKTKEKMENIVNVDFDKFRFNNENTEKAFEQLSYILFCRQNKITEGVAGYRNQTGIEKPPVSIGAKKISFQSKFFESKINYSKLEQGLKKAKAEYPQLNHVIFYVNKLRNESSVKGIVITKDEQDLINTASRLKVKIEWFDPGNFSIALNNPSNIDLGQIYFGAGDNYSFIKDGSNLSIQTFILSKEYITLPLTNGDKVVSNPVKSIIARKEKVFLIFGHPGSGKSIYSHVLFRSFAGLDKKNQEEMSLLWLKNKAIPMLINLKDCLNQNLETLVRDRQNDYLVRGRKLGFIYIFDGLDELGADKADQVLFYIRELKQLQSTIKIIISCRSGNSNKDRALIYLPEAHNFEFFNLNSSYIDTFFKSKDNKSKNIFLSKIKKTNPKLIKEIVDILFIKLLWDTIEKLDTKSTVTDLIEENIQILLHAPEHRKNIESLNILDEKSEKIISLNQEISFSSYQKFQFRLPKVELQNIIGNLFPRMDYKSTNEVLNYLTDVFFERNYSKDDVRFDYIYRHRRYQEFFFIQKLKYEYEIDPFILRRTRREKILLKKLMLWLKT